MVWRELPPIPAPSGGADGAGLSGHFAGVHRGVLLVAGGSYFNDNGRPWNGSMWVLSDGVHVMEQGSDGEYRWLDTVFRLPSARAYGASVSTPGGVVCIGEADSSDYTRGIRPGCRNGRGNVCRKGHSGDGIGRKVASGYLAGTGCHRMK